jgi:hypothetical protein
MIPLGAAAEPRKRRYKHLVDTSALPPVPRLTIDELLAARPPTPVRYFSDEEIKATLEEDRAEHWRAKLG